MDGISGAASLIALIEAVAVVGVAAVELGRHVHGAPEEIARVTSHLLTIKVELECLQLLQTDQEITKCFTSPETLEIFKSALQSSESTIRAIHDACQLRCYKGKKGPIARFQWAILDRKTVDRLLAELQRTEDSLKTVLQFLSFQQSSKISSSIGAIAKSQARLLEEFKSMKQDLDQVRQENNIEAEVEDTTIRSSLILASAPRNAYSRAIPDPFFSGLRGGLSSLWNDEASTYSLSFRTKIPLVNRAFSADLALRHASSSWLNFSLLSGSLGWKNVVSEESHIMTACKRGDIHEVHNLFDNNLASPNDMTISNSTPLRFAIESGNLDLVDLLLRKGADPNWTFGQNQTSPLDWALQQRKLEIARVLISRKASLDHVSAHGWTPLFYIWSGPKQTSSLDYLVLLTSACPYSLEFNDADMEKWPLLHRAASFGTREDVAMLIKLGASTMSLILPLQWLPIHEAAFYGKTECFLELLPHHKSWDIDTPDARGWTLLHIAASAGSDGIVKILLEKGADPLRRSWPFWSHMPESLHGKRWTPAEVARAQSEERYELYMTVLRDLGLGSSMEEDEDKELVFLDSQETLEEVS